MRAAFIHVTNACNLKCFHCAYSSGVPYKQELPFNAIEKVAQIVRKNGGTSIMIGGGEPLLRNDIERILDMLSSYDLNIKLETNLTVNPPIIQKLPKYRNLVVTTSIDSMKPDVHDCQRGAKGSFEKTRNHVIYLRNNGLPVRVNALMLKSNKDDINKYLNFAKKTGAVYRPLFRLIDIGRCSESKGGSLALEPFEIQEILDKLFVFARSENNRKLVSFSLPPALIPPDLIETLYECEWGRFIGVAANGTVALCPAALDTKELTGEKIEMYTSGRLELEEISFVKYARTFDVDTLEGICGRCILRKACKGGCRVDSYTRYNSKTAPDPICEAFYNAGLFPKYALDVDN